MYIVYCISTIYSAFFFFCFFLVFFSSNWQNYAYVRGNECVKLYTGITCKTHKCVYVCVYLYELQIFIYTQFGNSNVNFCAVILCIVCSNQSEAQFSFNFYSFFPRLPLYKSRDMVFSVELNWVCACVCVCEKSTKYI